MMGLGVKKKKNEYETESKDQNVTVGKQVQRGDWGRGRGREGRDVR